MKFLFLVLLLNFCTPPKILHLEESYFTFTVESGLKKSQLCVFETTKYPECRAQLIPNKFWKCKYIHEDKSFLSLSSKEFSSILISEISDFNLKFPKYSSVEKKILFIPKEGLPDEKGFEANLHSHLSKVKISLKIEQPVIGEFGIFLRKSIEADADSSPDIFYSGDRWNETLEKGRFQSNNFSFSPEEYYDKLSSSKEFSPCRQSLSRLFTDTQTGSEKFAACTKILEDKLNFSRASEDTTVAYGEFWKAFRDNVKSNVLEENILQFSASQFCSVSADQLQKQGFGKNLSKRFCYTLAYANAMLKESGSKKIELLPEEAFSKGVLLKSLCR